MKDPNKNRYEVPIPLQFPPPSSQQKLGNDYEVYTGADGTDFKIIDRRSGHTRYENNGTMNHRTKFGQFIATNIYGYLYLCFSVIMNRLTLLPSAPLFFADQFH